MKPHSLHLSAKILDTYESGSLGEGEASSIEEHLRHCRQCRESMDRIRSGDAEARRLREVISDSLEGSDLGLGGCSGDAGHASDGGSSGDSAISSGDGGSSKWIAPDYERIKLCGEGSYGSVWAVRDRVGVFRALKIIDMNKVSRARGECRESIALQTYCRRVSRHPHLIGVYHIGMVGNQLYYTMDLADDYNTKTQVPAEFPDNYRPFTLKAILRRRRRPRTDAAIEIVRRLLGGLSELHNLDLVHRDIKPSNILFVRRTPRLADIGMVSLGSDSTAIVGTPRYMPPDRIIDKTADTYAMGKVLHEMIAGDEGDVFPELPDRCLTMSMKWEMDKIAELIVRACNPRAAERFQSANQMLEELEVCEDSMYFPGIEIAAGEEGVERPGVKAQIVLAALNAIPWVLGFLALVIIIWWLNRTR